jgi:hypothetical protein
MMNEQTEQAYHALQRWAERLNKWAYSQQVKKNKGKRLKQFTPNSTSLILLDACKELIKGARTADEAMALLWAPGISGELRNCMDAGF